MKRMSLNEKDIKTILAVFASIRELPYDKMNTFLGSLTIEEMVDLYVKLNNWYQPNVLGKIYDDEMGWIDPDLDY